MRVVFDTNVLLDAILKRPEREVALQLMLAVANEEIEGIVTANSITDFYYVCRKNIGDEKARQAVSSILEMFDIAPVDGDACFAALNTGMKDYEDAVLAVCAEISNADLIATQDKDFVQEQNSPVKVMKPEDVLVQIKKMGLLS